MNGLFRSLPLLLVAACTSLPLKASETDHPEIHQVIESFRTSIIERDKSRFLDLFLQENVNWQASMEDESLSRVKVKRPQAIKARVNPQNTHIAFADSFAKDEKRNEETIANIKIDSDGDAASVGFDYVYLYDGREINRGREYWLLVRTETGWKITSVAYSMILPKPTETSGQ